MDEQTRLAREAMEGLRANHPSDKSVADEIGINSAHISRLMKDQRLSPTLEKKLFEMGLIPHRPVYQEVEVCPVCGVVHTIDCPHSKKKRASKKRKRVSINYLDPKSAAKSIFRVSDRDFIEGLSHYLQMILLSETIEW